jgi:hypothetical protein
VGRDLDRASCETLIGKPHRRSFNCSGSRLVWKTDRMTMRSDSIRKMNYERKTTKHNRPPHLASDFGKRFRVVCNTLKNPFNYGAKLPPQAFALVVVPCDRVVKLPFRNAPKDQAALHPGCLASSLAFTSSHGTTSLGLSRWSCRRRSINSASPGVNSLDPTTLSHRLRHSSICSASGSARASLRTISELVKVNLQTFRILASA